MQKAERYSHGKEKRCRLFGGTAYGHYRADDGLNDVGDDRHGVLQCMIDLPHTFYRELHVLSGCDEEAAFKTWLQRGSEFSVLRMRFL